MNQIVPFNIWMVLLCAIGGYLVGNIQTAIIVSKGKYHDDVRNHGSGNAGSTNMVRVFGFGPGAITFIGDFLKGILGVLIGRLLMGTYGGYIAGYCVIIGHCYPVFAGFRGGKGVASSCGVAIMVYPIGMIISLVVGVLLVVFTKKVSIMSLTGVLTFFIITLIFRLQDIPLVILATMVVAIVCFRHTDNIKRIIHGEEKPLVSKSESK